MKWYTVPKSSFFYRFAICFIFMIILPMICLWWIYEVVLKVFYAGNSLEAWQINMEKSVSVLDSSLSATSNVIIALRGNTEIVYYLDDRSYKSPMPYATFKRMHSFCENLYLMTPYLSSLKIYSDSPILIYAGPFVRMEDIPLDSDFLETLENAGLRETVWRTVVSETGGFPSIYGYQKIFTENYSECIGYVEVRLSEKIFLDYFDLLTRLSDDPQSVLTLYQENQPVYSTGSATDGQVLPGGLDSGYELSIFRNEYWNYLNIPELNMSVVRNGRLSDRQNMFTNKMPSVIMTLIILLMLALFLSFFMNIARLSRRILKFSSFIKGSNPDNLQPFPGDQKAVDREDELDILTGTYNTLICKNNSLISQIRKMELFTQEARYQALQEQIHPHFIYGTLETIRMMALQSRDKGTANMIYSLSTLIRCSISISSKSVTLQDELEIASHYLTIQKIRFADRMTYAFQIEGHLGSMKLPSFTLQPILENAIVYGVSQTLEECILTVEAYEKGSQVILAVSNTGLLITPQRLLDINGLLSGNVSLEDFRGRSNGMALHNIRERLAIFFNGRVSIRLEVQDNRTVTVIKIDR